MKVQDVMTREVEVLRPDATLREAAQKMLSHDVGLLPVVEGERVIGMLSDRDITVRAVAQGRDPNTTPVPEVMTPEVVSVRPDEGVRAAAKLMADNQIRRLLVMSDDRRLVGIVSLGDLAVDTGDEKMSGKVLEEVSKPGHLPGSQA
jgi:CBS domain-containing protein